MNHKQKPAPSSSSRMERWALALRYAQIDREGKRGIGDEKMQDHIERRLEGELRRGGASSEVISAIRTAIGCECAEFREAERLSRSIEAWGAIFAKDWSRTDVSLSGAVHWIATQGRSELCAVTRDSRLEQAAEELRDAASGGMIAVHGLKDGDTGAVPDQFFTVESPFTGDVPERILFSSVSVVRWMLDLESYWLSGDGDTIETGDKVVWRRLSVNRVELESLWSASKSEAEAQEPTKGELKVPEPAADSPAQVSAAAPMDGQQESTQMRSRSWVLDPICAAMSGVFGKNEPKGNSSEIKKILLDERPDLGTLEASDVGRARRKLWPRDKVRKVEKVR